MSKRGYYLGGHTIVYGRVTSSKNRPKVFGLLELSDDPQINPSPATLYKADTTAAKNAMKKRRK